MPLDADEDGFPIAMSDVSEVASVPKSVASRVKTRAQRKNIGQIEKVVKVQGQKAQILFVDKQKKSGKHWVNLKDIEDSAQYTAFLISQEKRRQYNEKKIILILKNTLY